MQSVLNVKDYGAFGDGAHDDTAAIQAALDDLSRIVSAPSVMRDETSCDGFLEGPYKAWAAWAVAVYFPAGVYRLCGRLRIPYAQGFRIFGDGGRWGGIVYGDVPGGTVLRQDVDDEPIFAFEQNFTHGWTIERLAFTWANDQGAPPSETLENRPGAVGIWFSSVPLTAPLPSNIDYYNARVSECTFQRCWRGIALDDRTEKDGGPAVPITLWGTEIAACGFWHLAGAAVSLRNAPGRYFGMPSNALRNLYVTNNSPRPNGEPQIVVDTQSACVMDTLDLEGSQNTNGPTVIYAGGTVAMTGVHIEHVAVVKAYYRLIYVNQGPTTISGLTVDGFLNARPPRNTDPNPFGSIIHAEDCNLVLSGATGYRTPDAALDGIALEGGHAYLVTANGKSSVRLLGTPNFPNPKLPLGGIPNDPLYKYQVRLWDPYALGTAIPSAVVESEPARVLEQLTVAPLAAGAAVTVTVTIPGARPGDVVAAGAASGAPPELLVSGSVAVNDKVRLRLFNSGPAPVNASGWWSLAAGNGFASGGPQMVDTDIESFPPYPMPSVG